MAAQIGNRTPWVIEYNACLAQGLSFPPNGKPVFTQRLHGVTSFFAPRWHQSQAAMLAPAYFLHNPSH